MGTEWRGPEALARVVRAETVRLFPKSMPYWSELAGARILMTGCSGLFGLWLLELFDRANSELGLGIRVAILTRQTRNFFERYPQFSRMHGLEVIEGDVRGFKLGAFQPTHLIHGATTSASETFEGASPLQKFDTLVSGTNHVFSLLPKGGVRSALFLSSGVVYGTLPNGLDRYPEDFTSAPQPEDISAGLGHAKRAAEFLCHAHASTLEIPIRVARCFSFSGAGVPLDLHYAIGDFVRQSLVGSSIEITGDGSAVRSYLHLADLATWLVALLGDPDRSKPGVLNVGSPRGVSIRQLAETVAAALTPSPSVVIKGLADYAVGNPVRRRYVPNTSSALAYDLSDWTPIEHSLQTMLQTSGIDPSRLAEVRS